MANQFLEQYVNNLKNRPTVNPVIAPYVKPPQQQVPQSTPPSFGIPTASAATTAPAAQKIDTTDKYAEGIKKARELGYSDQEVNDYLKKQGKFSPTLNKVEQGGKSGLGDFVGATKLGQYIGQSLYKMTPESRGLDKAIFDMQNSMTQLDQQIAKNQQIGKDTSRLEQLKNDLTFDLQQSQYTQQQLQSGTTGKQAIGSAIQTAASAMPFTGLVGKGLTKAGIPLGAKMTGLASSGIGGMALEGGLGGAAYGIGAGIEQDKSIGGIAGNALGYGLTGSVLGPIAGGVVKGLGKVGSTLAPEATKAAGDFLGQDVAKLKTDILRNFSNSADSGFTKNTNLLKKEYFGEGGDPTASPLFKGGESVYNRSAEPINVITYDKKGKTLTTKTYDPLNDGPLEASDAIDQMKKNVWDERVAALDVVDTSGFAKQKQTLIAELEAKKASYTSNEQKNSIQKYIDDIKQNIQTPSQLNEYNYNTLGTKTKSKMGSNADNIAAEIAQDAKIISEKNMESYLGTFTSSPELSALKAELEHLTAVQKLANENIQKLDPNISLSDLNLYGVSNMIAGGFFGNPAQFAKGTAFTALSNLIGKKSPFVNFTKGMKGIDDLYKGQGIERKASKIDLEALKQDVANKAGTIVPVGESYGPGSTKGVPQGTGPFDYTGKLEAPIKYEPLPKQIEDAVLQLPPEKQEEGRRLMQQTLDLFGKKKINPEQGSITGGILAALGAITGIPIFSEWAENTKPMTFGNETAEADSSAKVYENQEEELPNPMRVGTTTYEARPVPREYQDIMQDAYAKNPQLPKGILEMILNVESMMGTRENKDLGKDFFEGEYGWLVGAEKKKGSHVDSIRQKIKAGDKRYNEDMIKFDTKEDAIMSVANMLSAFQKGKLENGQEYFIDDVKKLYDQKWQGNTDKTIPQVIQYYADAYKGLYK